MALLLVLLCTILAFSLSSTQQCVSSPGSSIDLTLRSHKNTSGDWIITVDTRRLTRKDNPREFSVNVQHETKICGRYEIEEHVSMAFVYPSLHDTSMPGAMEPSTTGTTSTATTVTPSTTPTPSTTTITTATPSTTTTITTSTTTPKSCPHSGYQLYPEFNCYKAFPSARKTWSEARDQCVRDGGDLMVMETERERQDVFIPLRNSVSWSSPLWVGAYKPEGEDGWITVNGEPALSTWWVLGEPDGTADRKCAFAYHDGLLVNGNCTDTRTFICEISL